MTVKFSINKFKQIFKKELLKNSISIIFIVGIILYFICYELPTYSNLWLESNRNNISKLNNELVFPAREDSLGEIQTKRNKIAISKIEKQLIKYLIKSRTFSDINILSKYLVYKPELLSDIPSCTPLENKTYTLSSGYGLRRHPIDNTNKLHSGIDLSAEEGAKVFSTAKGIVTSVKKNQTGYGYHIIIKHRFGFTSLYGHLKDILVQKNQRINQHELIETVGSTGYSTGPHLHYEVKKNGKKIDPMESFNLKINVIKNN